MDKYIFNDSNGLWYELCGDYYLPCLTLPEDEHQIGIWGQRHKRYLKQEHRIIYETMLSKGTLFQYLEEVDRQAEEMLLRLTEDMAKRESVTEQLKAADQLEWVRQIAKFGFYLSWDFASNEQHSQPRRRNRHRNNLFLLNNTEGAAANRAAGPSISYGDSMTSGVNRSMTSTILGCRITKWIAGALLLDTIAHFPLLTTI